jgi:hypothetical protein
VTQQNAGLRADFRHLGRTGRARPRSFRPASPTSRSTRSAMGLPPARHNRRPASRPAVAKVRAKARRPRGPARSPTSRRGCAASRST